MFSGEIIVESGMNVLVIGGAGFMGSHTADKLTERGFAVTLFDLRESPWLRPEQKMVIGDTMDREALDAVMSDIDIIYHFAGMADIGEASRKPFETIQSNVIGTTTVLEAAVAAGVKRFMYASTMYVYSPFGSFYRASKQATENIIEAYSEKYGIDYTLLRYGSLYGPRSQQWNGPRNWVTQAVKDKHIDYRGTGKERREYIHVEDAATLSVKVLDEKYINSAVTITGTQVLTSRELMEMIEEICGEKIKVTYSEEYDSNYHYLSTPYRYTPKSSRKLIPEEFVDLGQGILDLIEEANKEIEG
jgi:UDP-glucose 4-epimerase